MASKTMQEIKDMALKMLVEESLYKVGESDCFEYQGREYKIERMDNGFALLWKVGNRYTGFVYPTMSMLFSFFFRKVQISY